MGTTDLNGARAERQTIKRRIHCSLASKHDDRREANAPIPRRPRFRAAGIALSFRRPFQRRGARHHGVRGRSRLAPGSPEDAGPGPADPRAQKVASPQAESTPASGKAPVGTERRADPDQYRERTGSGE